MKIFLHLTISIIIFIFISCTTTRLDEKIATKDNSKTEIETEYFINNFKSFYYRYIVPNDTDEYAYVYSFNNNTKNRSLYYIYDIDKVNNITVLSKYDQDLNLVEKSTEIIYEGFLTVTDIEIKYKDENDDYVEAYVTIDKSDVLNLEITIHSIYHPNYINEVKSNFSVKIDSVDYYRSGSGEMGINFKTLETITITNKNINIKNILTTKDYYIEGKGLQKILYYRNGIFVTALRLQEKVSREILGL